MALEEIDPAIRPPKNNSPFSPEQDLMMCKNICAEIRDQFEKGKLVDSEKQALLSRAILVGFRLQRVSPSEPSMLDAVEEYKSIARALNQKLRQEIVQPSRARVSFSGTVSSIGQASNEHQHDANPAINTPIESAFTAPLRRTGAVARTPITNHPVIKIRNEHISREELERILRWNDSVSTSHSVEPNNQQNEDFVQAMSSTNIAPEPPLHNQHTRPHKQ